MYKSVKIISDVVEAASPFCTKKLLVFRPTINFALNCRLIRTFHVPHTVIAFWSELVIVILLGQLLAITSVVSTTL